jgi:hypothetical protein
MGGIKGKQNLLERAQRDPAFLAELQRDPRAVLERELGFAPSAEQVEAALAELRVAAHAVTAPQRVASSRPRSIRKD